MRISHEQYLKNELSIAKRRLKDLEIAHKVRTGQYETEVIILENKITSIEKQLKSEAD